ncbi:unnamed protein product, partial [Ectocarpus sp. 4 AP-2014]
MPPLWRVMVLDEFLRWFEVPNSLMEIFLNYDMDRKFTRQWKVFEQMVIILCAIAEGRGETALGSANVRAEPVDDKAQQTLRLTALRSLAEVMQRLTDAAGHGYVMSGDNKEAKDSTSTATTAAPSASAAGGHGEWDTAPSDGTRPSSPSARGGESDGATTDGNTGGGEILSLPAESRLLLEQAGVPLRRRDSAHLDPSSEFGGAVDSVPGVALLGGGGGGLPSPGGSVVSYSSTARAESILGTSSVSTMSEAGGAAERGGGYNRRRFREPTSFKYCKELRNRAEEVVTEALQLYSTKGLKKAVQHLVASNFISDTPRDIANFLRIYKKDLDPLSIGDFLSEPDVDGGEYWKAIRLQYVRAIAFHGMTLEEALRHLLTDSGFRLPGESQKVDRLVSSFAECYVADNRDNPTCPFTNADTPFILSFAIIMLNTDLHRANAGTGRRRRRRMTKEDFISNLSPRAVESGARRRGAAPSSGHVRPPVLPCRSRHRGQRGLAQAHVPDRVHSRARCRRFRARRAGTTGRGVGPGVHRHRALRPGLFDLPRHDHGEGRVRQAAPQVLVRGGGLVGTGGGGGGGGGGGSSTGTLSPTTIFSGDGSIGSARSLSARSDSLRAASGRGGAGGGGGGGGGTGEGGVMTIGLAGGRGTAEGEAWLEEVEEVENAVEAKSTIAQVHSLVKSLERRVNDTYLMEELHTVAKRIRNHGSLFDGTPRRFLREGDLIKFTRTGRKMTYRFFLFSDQLVYAHQLFSGDWKMHEQLLLALVKVVYVQDKKDDSKFCIQHPKKSFTLSAKTVWNKRAWMTAISEAAEAALRARLETAGSPPPRAPRSLSSRQPIPRSWMRPPQGGSGGGGSSGGGSSGGGINKGGGRPIRSPTTGILPAAPPPGPTLGNPSNRLGGVGGATGQASATAAAAAAAAAAGRGGPQRPPPAAAAAAAGLRVDTEAVNTVAAAAAAAGTKLMAYGVSSSTTSSGNGVAVAVAEAGTPKEGGGGGSGGGGVAASLARRRGGPAGTANSSAFLLLGQGKERQISSDRVTGESAGSEISSRTERTASGAGAGTGGDDGSSAGGVGSRPSNWRVAVGGLRDAASPTSSVGSFGGASRELSVGGGGGGGGSSSGGTGSKQPGTPLSVGLMTMRSRLLKRWSSTLAGAGTPVSAGGWSYDSGPGSPNGGSSVAAATAATGGADQYQKSRLVDGNQLVAPVGGGGGGGDSGLPLSMPPGEPIGVGGDYGGIGGVGDYGGISGGGGGGADYGATADLPSSWASLRAGPSHAASSQPQHARTPPEPSAAPPPPPPSFWSHRSSGTGTSAVGGGTAGIGNEAVAWRSASGGGGGGGGLPLGAAVHGENVSSSSSLSSSALLHARASPSSALLLSSSRGWLTGMNATSVRGSASSASSSTVVRSPIAPNAASAASRQKTRAALHSAVASGIFHPEASAALSHDNVQGLGVGIDGIGFGMGVGSGSASS